MNDFPWMIFTILVTSGVLAGAAVLPYSLALNAKMLEKLRAKSAGEQGSGKPLPSIQVMAIAGIVQTAVLVALATFVGLLASRQVGLGTPVLSALVAGEPVWAMLRAMLPLSILVGLAAFVLLLGLEWFYFLPRIPRALAAGDAETPLWKRALACFYGGIVEEILLRLFVMSGLAWLIGLVWKTPAGLPTLGAFWLANVLSALLFGAGHLPATRAITRLTPVVVARGLILNGIPGIAFGYLYLRYGLESAIIAHFIGDIVVHLIAPNIARRLVNALPPEPAAETA